MSEEIGQAIGSIFAMAVGGIVLIKIASVIPVKSPIGLSQLGGLFIAAAVLLTILFVYAIAESLVS